MRLAAESICCWSIRAQFMVPLKGIGGRIGRGGKPNILLFHFCP